MASGASYPYPRQYGAIRTLREALCSCIELVVLAPSMEPSWYWNLSPSESLRFCSLS